MKKIYDISIEHLLEKDITIGQLIKKIDVYLNEANHLAKNNQEAKEAICNIQSIFQRIQVSLNTRKVNHSEKLKSLYSDLSEDLRNLLIPFFILHECLKKDPVLLNRQSSLSMKLETLCVQIYNLFIKLLNLGKNTNSYFQEKTSFSQTCHFFNKISVEDFPNKVSQNPVTEPTLYFRTSNVRYPSR